MRKRIISIVFVMVMSLFGFTNCVNAAYIHAKQSGYNKKIKGTYGDVMFINVDGTTAYCVDYGANIVATTATETGLKSYLQYGTSSEKASAAEKRINEILYFGSGSSDNGYLAIQKMIWETIADTGYYDSSYYKSHFAGANTGYSDNVQYYKIGVGDYSVSSEISSIENAIKNYYIQPSMCSSTTKLEIAVGETAEFTDSNNVLDKYSVTCGSGLSCKTEGSKLMVTALDALKDQNISFYKKGGGTEASVYYPSSTVAQAVVLGGSVGPVSCQFGIDTYQQVQTSDVGIILVLAVGLFAGVLAWFIYKAKKYEVE